MAAMKTAYEYHAYPSMEQKETFNLKMYLSRGTCTFSWLKKQELCLWHHDDQSHTPRKPTPFAGRGCHKEYMQYIAAII
ncbi:MAG: hypothetical protein LVQ97_01570 [Candidatus Micrarchaeales archaeon]|jgi:hypothetical protein|nr:hypothetical protein [Candidatus Micrarchaeales archaeon]